MSRGEKILFRVGRFVVVWTLGLWMWLILPIAAWYIKNIPLRRGLPFAQWLRTSLLQDNGGKFVFYDWLSGFLKSWLLVSFLFTTISGALVFLLLFVLSSTYFHFLSVVIDHPAKIAGILYLLLVIGLDTLGFSIAKSNCWDALIWQAEPAGRALLGPEYDKLTPERKKELHRHIAEVEAGINKGTWLVANCEPPRLLHVPSDSFAKFGGPGVLVVQEGHVVVTERSGRVARMVGAGYYQLAQYERPQMVIYLPARPERVLVNDALTHDKMVVTSLELMIFHRADRGDQSGTSGQYRYDSKIILEKIWSPKGGDWRDAVKSISESAARDVIAQYNFEELVAISDAARRKFLDEVIEKTNKTTKGFLGVDVIAANLGAIAISDEAKKVIEAKNLAEAKRQTLTTQMEGEAAALITKARAEREKLLIEADAKRIQRLADAEIESRSIITKAEAEKKARIAKGEGEKEFLSRQGEGRAFATREEKIAEAQGLGERVRQLSNSLAQWIVEDEKALKLLESMFRGEDSRQLMSFMMSTMRRDVRRLGETNLSEGESEGNGETLPR